jgi:uncharacterized protein YbjT (DUF2867 family)
MIVVAGGSGQLGRDVVTRLAMRGLPVRVMSRDPVRARQLLGPLADRIEVLQGDVRDADSLSSTMSGATCVVSAIQGFGGHEAGGLDAIDRHGNEALIAAAAAAGVERFVLLSIFGASPVHPLALARAKADAEAALRGSGMAWTIIRPTAYMETWAAVVGGPILATGRARVFGRGQNPINFVSATDVAGFVERAVVDPGLAGSVLDVAGPENVTFDELVGMFAAELGHPVPVAHVPRVVLRAMAFALRPIRPVLAAQVAAAVVLDTTDGAVSSAPSRLDRDIPVTRFESVVATMVAGGAGHEAPAAR